MKTDIQYKMSALVNNLKKNESHLLNEENRNMRQLEKVETMQKTLTED